MYKKGIKNSQNFDEQALKSKKSWIKKKEKKTAIVDKNTELQRVYPLFYTKLR